VARPTLCLSDERCQRRIRVLTGDGPGLFLAPSCDDGLPTPRGATPRTRLPARLPHPCCSRLRRGHYILSPPLLFLLLESPPTSPPASPGSLGAPEMELLERGLDISRSSLNSSPCFHAPWSSRSFGTGDWPRSRCIDNRARRCSASPVQAGDYLHETAERGERGVCLHHAWMQVYLGFALGGQLGSPLPAEISCGPPLGPFSRSCAGGVDFDVSHAQYRMASYAGSRSRDLSHYPHFLAAGWARGDGDAHPF